MYVCVRCSCWTWQPCELSWSDWGWHGGRYWVLGQLPQDLELASQSSSAGTSPQHRHHRMWRTICGHSARGTFHIKDERVRSSLRTVPRSQQGHSVASRASFFVASNDSVIVDRSSSSLLCLSHSSARFACCSLLLIAPACLPVRMNSRGVI